ncbi:unnamed protein product [Allacma fusca]|uniref:Uncharacterized protein n=1 Tax=Allacma fusca TaxID=39272 RepID=A0A8J2JGY6_9HEXA|nr:unnamed protein product [Allacma fusca]
MGSTDLLGSSGEQISFEGSTWRAPQVKPAENVKFMRSTSLSSSNDSNGHPCFLRPSYPQMSSRSQFGSEPKQKFL